MVPRRQPQHYRYYRDHDRNSGRVEAALENSSALTWREYLSQKVNWLKRSCYSIMLTFGFCILLYLFFSFVISLVAAALMFYVVAIYIFKFF